MSRLQKSRPFGILVDAAVEDALAPGLVLQLAEAGVEVRDQNRPLPETLFHMQMDLQNKHAPTTGILERMPTTAQTSQIARGELSSPLDARGAC